MSVWLCFLWHFSWIQLQIMCFCKRLLVKKCLKIQFKNGSLQNCLLCAGTKLVHPLSLVPYLWLNESLKINKQTNNKRKSGYWHNSAAKKKWGVAWDFQITGGNLSHLIVKQIKFNSVMKLLVKHFSGDQFPSRLKLKEPSESFAG